MVSDLISRGALEKYLRDYKWEFALNSDFSKAVEMVDVQPTIDAVPVVERNKVIAEFAHELKEEFNVFIPLDYASTQPYFTLEQARATVDEVADRLMRNL